MRSSGVKGAAITAVIVGAMAGPASAQTCATTVVTARGDPASYQWLALIKAKGDWRSKVRALPELGTAFANWKIAADQVERCIKDGTSVRCIVSARPCRG